jgi:hypothetical protein
MSLLVLMLAKWREHRWFHMRVIFFLAIGVFIALEDRHLRTLLQAPVLGPSLALAAVGYAFFLTLATLVNHWYRSDVTQLDVVGAPRWVGPALLVLHVTCIGWVSVALGTAAHGLLQPTFLFDDRMLVVAVMGSILGLALMGSIWPALRLAAMELADEIRRR